MKRQPSILLFGLVLLLAGCVPSAIAAAEVVLPQTQRPEIRSLAEDIIASQQAEIDEMAAWLAAWYPEAS